MNWLNVDMMLPQKPEFTAAKYEQRGVWFTLLAWCARVENGGCIAAARTWSEEMWLQTCGLRAKSVRGSCTLWRWDDEDLILWGYPSEQEDTTKQNRVDGKKGGRPKKENNPPVLPEGITGGENPKEKERKGIVMEGEGNTETPPPIEFPSDFPDTEAKAVSWAKNGPTICKAPDDYILSVWTQIIGQGFVNAAGNPIRHWGSYISQRWEKESFKWAADHRGTANSAEKKEGGAATETPKLPSFPWRAVCKYVLKWLHVPDTTEQWFTLLREQQKEIRAAWKSMPPEAQELLRDQAGKENLG
jgi:hypothetical protein